MPYIDPKIVLEAKKMDLLTYLKNFEPHELVKLNENNYTTRTHDSLKISNGKWMWFSRGIGGTNALNYLIEVKGLSFVEAVETIKGKQAVVSPKPIRQHKKYYDRPLLLPEKSKSNDRIIKYLFKRGIDIEIIDYCISNGLIYESKNGKYHNIIFVGFDENSKPMYAAYRSLTSERYLGDCTGSKKKYSFRILNGKGDEVHIFESAIDLLSYATFLKYEGKNFRDFNLISLSGVYSPKPQLSESKPPMAIESFLADSTNIKRIFLHLDNDYAGRLASKTLQQIYKIKYEIVDSPPTYGKDYNDFLCLKLGINKSKERSFAR